MKKSSLLLFISVFLVFLGSCSKDDSETIYPKELNFSEETTLDFNVWVGGSEINTETINPEDIFGEFYTNYIDFENIYKNYTFIFKNDFQLELKDEKSQIVEYEFRNDSLFLFGISGEQLFWCTGNMDRLTFNSGILYTHYEFSDRRGTRISTTQHYFTLDDGLEQLEINSLDEMGVNDSIALLNRIIIFE